MISKTLYTVWVGDNPKNDVIKKCEESWKVILPDFTHIELTDKDIPDSPYVKICKRRGIMAGVADYTRIYYLYHHGGITLDSDVEVIKDLTPLLENKAFAGWQDDYRHINYAVSGSEKGNEYIKTILDKFDSSKDFRIAPQVATEAYLHMGEYVTIYPKEYFYPFDWTEEEYSTENSYAKHHWEGSWLK